MLSLSPPAADSWKSGMPMPSNGPLWRLGDGGGAGILLRAIDAIGKAVVRADVIELAGGLVEPAAPGAAIQGDQRALVHAEDLARAGSFGSIHSVWKSSPVGSPLTASKCRAAVVGLAT